MELMIVIAAAILAWVVGAIWYRLTDRVYAHASALQVQNIGHPKARSVVPYLLAGVALVAVAALATALLNLCAAVLRLREAEQTRSREQRGRGGRHRR